MMRAGSWRSLTIATGEIPIVGDSTQQGAANRTLEISAEPFDDVREAQAMHHLVVAQHGTAGRAFIEALRRNPRAHPREGALAGIRRNIETGGFPAALRVARRLERAVPAAKAGPVDVEEAGGMRWTEEQDDVLREVSFHGAAFAAAEIARRCGVAYTVRAVEMRASRIHCSLAVQTVRPECEHGGAAPSPARRERCHGAADAARACAQGAHAQGRTSAQGAAEPAAEGRRDKRPTEAVAKTRLEPTSGLLVAPPCARPRRGGCAPGATGGVGCDSTHEARALRAAGRAGWG